jgi:uncharacterized membrane protein YoaK (UPF0700 family)
MTHLEDSLERRVFRNAPRLLIPFVLGAVVVSIALRAVRETEPSAIILGLRALLAGAQTFLWLWVALMVVMFGCAAASLLSRRLFGQVSSSTTHRVLAALILSAVGIFVTLVPMCFGSLSEGTYECVTLYDRAVALLTGG